MGSTLYLKGERCCTIDCVKQSLCQYARTLRNVDGRILQSSLSSVFLPSRFGKNNCLDACQYAFDKEIAESTNTQAHYMSFSCKEESIVIFESQQCVDATSGCVLKTCSEQNGQICEINQGCSNPIISSDSQMCCENCQSLEGPVQQAMICQNVTYVTHSGTFKGGQALSFGHSGNGWGRLTADWTPFPYPPVKPIAVSITPVDDFIVVSEYEPVVLHALCDGSEVTIHVPSFKDIKGKGFETLGGYPFYRPMYVTQSGSVCYNQEMTICED